MEITGCFANLGKAANTASNCLAEWGLGSNGPELSPGKAVCSAGEGIPMLGKNS